MVVQALEGFPHCMDYRYMLLNLAHFSRGFWGSNPCFHSNRSVDQSISSVLKKLIFFSLASSLMGKKDLILSGSVETSGCKGSRSHLL